MTLEDKTLSRFRNYSRIMIKYDEQPSEYYDMFGNPIHTTSNNNKKKRENFEVIKQLNFSFKNTLYIIIPGYLQRYSSIYFISKNEFF